MGYVQLSMRSRDLQHVSTSRHSSLTYSPITFKAPTPSIVVAPGNQTSSCESLTEAEKEDRPAPGACIGH